ncbi:hypothetical protein [uncultured Tateyamaria sp.]|uniref:hypothetical protein n=1 Tax=uncultured Tateyamaria sp. TaxID=455651 RepID=UPI0026280EFB|nr:hypothetical protein [uncultured Tateyamaria sp.]
MTKTVIVASTTIRHSNSYFLNRPHVADVLAGIFRHPLPSDNAMFGPVRVIGMGQFIELNANF